MISIYFFLFLAHSLSPSTNKVHSTSRPTLVLYNPMNINIGEKKPFCFFSYFNKLLSYLKSRSDYGITYQMISTCFSIYSTEKKNTTCTSDFNEAVGMGSHSILKDNVPIEKWNYCEWDFLGDIQRRVARKTLACSTEEEKIVYYMSTFLQYVLADDYHSKHYECYGNLYHLCRETGIQLEMYAENLLTGVSLSSIPLLPDCLVMNLADFNVTNPILKRLVYEHKNRCENFSSVFLKFLKMKTSLLGLEERSKKCLQEVFNVSLLTASCDDEILTSFKNELIELEKDNYKELSYNDALVIDSCGYKVHSHIHKSSPRNELPKINKRQYLRLN